MVRKCWGKGGNSPPEPLVRGLEVAGKNVAIPTAAFLAPPHPNLLCMVCQEVPNMPFRCRECEQPLCGPCSVGWFSPAGQGKKTCPSCRHRVGGVADLKRGWGPGYGMVANEAQMKCPYSTASCKVEGNLGEIKSHLEEGCPEEPLPCGLDDCPLFLKRRDIGDHRKGCGSRPMQCRMCEEVVLRKDLKEHRSASCPARPVECKKGCGYQGLLERDLPDHKAVCPMQRVGCVCGQRMRRCKIDRHLQRGAISHLSLLMQKVTDLQSQVARLEKDS